MRFHVLGLGSIGTLLSHHLRVVLDPKHAVVLFHKDRAKRLAAYKLDSPVTVLRDGVTHSSSGFLHEVSDPYHSSVFDTSRLSRDELAEHHNRTERQVWNSTPIHS